MGTVLFWQPFPARCKCPSAVRYWRQKDKEAAETKLREKREKEQKLRQDRIDYLIGSSGIKKRFLQRTFENFRRDTQGRERAYQTAKSYADSFKEHLADGEGLYIEGTNGTGKTHLAAAVALQLLNESYPVICKTAGDLLLDIKSAYDSKEYTEREVLDVYKKVDLLIVDDLGKEQCSDWAISTLYAILNDRYEDMKPVIITTNYNADDLVKALTPKGYDSAKPRAIVSRLRESCRVITMAWEDIRVTQKGNDL